MGEIVRFRNSRSNTRPGTMQDLAFIDALAPVVLIFLAFQRYFVEGIGDG